MRSPLRGDLPGLTPGARISGTWQSWCVNSGLTQGYSMHSFDYGAGAELFTSKSKWSRRVGPVGYKRFARAADAIRFAIEDLPGDSLASAWLEIGDDRFSATEIHRLYEDEAYPLDRRELRPRDTVEGDGSAAARKPLWCSQS